VADTHSPAAPEAPPLTPGLKANFRFDLQAGFLVFLIAMPLCLGIASASRYPPIVGIWTAVIGGIVTCFLSNSQLTIKGPAAGLIVIAEGAVLGLGGDVVGHDASAEAKIIAGYPLALGVGITAGVIQILFGLVKAGKLGELVPLTPVHGMLAAIGITIMAKQFFIMLGLGAPAGAPIDAIAAIPEAFGKLNPHITALGVTALLILIAFPFLKNRVAFLKPVPAQLVVLAVAIPLGFALGLENIAKAVVSVPNVLDDPKSAFFLPDFSGVATATGIQFVILYALIGSIESMLSSQAIDMIDPWRRKTDQNRDLLAVGVANTLCAAVGALPMISEIVRSKANIDNGARTKYANLFHGVFLLAFVLLLPVVINTIPMAALAAMLVFTGFRLASPKEFIHTYKIGAEQLVVFVVTIGVTLCTDLLIGVCSGIVLKVVIHLINGAPIRSLLRPDIEVAHNETDKVAVLKVRAAAVFSNWLGLKGAITKSMAGRDEVVLDLSATRLVDHSTMEKLHQLEREFAEAGKKLTVAGLENHTPMSSHPLAARRGKASSAPTPQEPTPTVAS
jgi:MFS superfamily sulfate permease-like transporter